MQSIHPDLEIFITADGSPTLTFRRPDGYAEKMHHSGGAFSESMYIYHYGLKKSLELGFPPRVISVGLGLGYNELISLAEFARSRVKGQIWSFETMPFLRDMFRSWAEGQSSQPLLDQIARQIEQSFGIEGLRNITHSAIKEGQLELREAFPESMQNISDVGTVFFDAFSNKMSPELWSEEGLKSSLDPVLSKNCLLCTYAATGALKRALRTLGFELLDRPGFQGKRDSTLAVRQAATS